MARRRPLLALALAVAAALPAAAADGDAGAYLAARIAGQNADWREASAWYTRALLSDPGNPALMDGAIVAHLSAGNHEAAAAVARRMLQTGQPSQVARLVLLGDQAARGAFDETLADFAGGLAIGRLLDGLVQAWAQVGEGRMSEALAAFDALAAAPGLEPFALYHKALALASVGDFEGADDILSGRATGSLPLTRRGVLARAQVLGQLDRPQDAVALLDSAFPDRNDPAILGLRERLAAGERIPFDMVQGARDGVAEVFFTLAAALNGEAEDGYTLLHARIATWLRPDHAEAMLLAGALLEAQGQNELAVAAYARVAPSDPAFFGAEIGRARALQADGKLDAALEVLRGLARRYPGVLTVHVALGDALRREERWEEADAAYDDAVALIGTPEQRHWRIFYSRAIVNERLKRWDEAEPDFRKALELEPGQPQVLNYLGYSFLEMNRNLDEALAMIERAVQAEPESGYIVDSYAWALFRLGRYAEALAPMEKASLLEPVDPIVTDHLGDVYWAVGRRMEARFQWRRALSFDPEEKDAARIRRKLDIGLDAVLAEEGAAPLTAVANGQD
jgi:tetratricopeptide (TPR) repeat protein